MASLTCKFLKSQPVCSNRFTNREAQIWAERARTEVPQDTGSGYPLEPEDEEEANPPLRTRVAAG